MRNRRLRAPKRRARIRAAKRRRPRSRCSRSRNNSVLVDRPPPSRFSVVERGGRLVVIDRETGRTPPTAAERMDLHDRKTGVEPIRPAKTAAKPGTAPDMSAAGRAESGLSAPPAPAQKKGAASAKMAADGKDRIVAVHAGRNKRPWNLPQPNDRPAPEIGRAHV